MRRRRPGTAAIAGGAAFLIVLAIGIGTTGGDHATGAEPAPPAALEKIAARNEKAATAAAARMRANSQESAAAADAELTRRESEVAP